MKFSCKTFKRRGKRSRSRSQSQTRRNRRVHRRMIGGTTFDRNIPDGAVVVNPIEDT